MTKEEMIRLAERYDAKAQRAAMSYQETGEQRYYRQSCSALDLSDALRIAAGAAEDHQKLTSLRTELNLLARQAEAALLHEEDRQNALENVIAAAVLLAAYKRTGGNKQ